MTKKIKTLISYLNILGCSPHSLDLSHRDQEAPLLQAPEHHATSVLFAQGTAGDDGICEGEPRGQAHHQGQHSQGNHVRQFKLC